MKTKRNRISFFVCMSVFVFHCLCLAQTAKAPFSILENTPLTEMIEKHEFEKLEESFVYFRDHNRMNKDGFTLLTMAYDSIRYHEGLLPHLDAWCEASPDSHFPLVIRGKFLMDHAGELIRHYQWNQITDEVWEEFRKRFSLSRKDLEKALELDPTDPNVPSYLIYGAEGGVMFRFEMEEYFKKATSLDQSLLAPYVYKLKHVLRKGGYGVRQTLRFVDKYVKSAPEGSRVGETLLQVHEWMAKDYREGKKWWLETEVWEGIESFYSKRIEQDPSRIRDRRALAFYAVKTQHYDVAREQFEQIGIEWYGGPWKKVREGQFYRYDEWGMGTYYWGPWNSVKQFLKSRQTTFKKTKGDTPSPKNHGRWMIEECTKKIRQFPEESFYYFSRGCAYKSVNERRKAIKDFRKATKLDPDVFDYWKEWGSLHEKAKEYEEAILCYTKAVSLGPGRIEVMHVLATCYSHLNQLDKAIEYFEKCLELSPHFVCCYNHLGNIYSRAERYEEGLECTLKGIESAEKYGSDHGKSCEGELYFNNASCALRVKHFDQARKSFEKSLMLNPTHIYCNNNYAWMLLTSDDESFHDYPRALELAKYAVFLSNREDKYCLGTLATAYELNNMPEKAAEALRDRILLKRNDKEARERLKTLKKEHNIDIRIPANWYVFSEPKMIYLGIGALSTILLVIGCILRFRARIQVTSGK